MICDQIVTWTTFAILAMFRIVANEIPRVLSVSISKNMVIFTDASLSVIIVVNIIIIQYSKGAEKDLYYHCHCS